MNNQLSETCKEAPLNEIPAAMDELGKELCLLDEQIGGLISSIQPVIQQIPTGTEVIRKDQDIRSAQSEIGDRIGDAARRVRAMRLTVQDIRNKVAL
ncbi:MAG: hypothetical protein WCK57_07620 [Verrucomicrobiae bacterium]